MSKTTGRPAGKPKNGATNGNTLLGESIVDNGVDQQAQITRIVDEHVNWMVGWHRQAFLASPMKTPGELLQDAQNLAVPKAFASWFRGAAQKLTTEQPLIDKLAILHDQLHRLAKMVLVKAAGEPLPPTDYEMVMARYLDFMQSLRTFERNFSAAAAGLDTLTGLKSRFTLMADLTAEQNRLARAKAPFTIAIGDIDQFRSLNQLHGAETGDRALVMTAESIQKTIRIYDDAYRIGGDEFLICLKGANGTEAFKVIERLRSAVAAQPVRLFGGGGLALTASFGLVEARKDEDLASLVARAEQALQEAKQNGGNQTQLNSTHSSADAD